MPGMRRTPNQSEVRERYEKRGSERERGEWVGGSNGEANDTSLGNFNFAEITVGLIRIKRSSRSAFSLSLSLSLSLSPLLFLFFLALARDFSYSFLSL